MRVAVNVSGVFAGIGDPSGVVTIQGGADECQITLRLGGGSCVIQPTEGDVGFSIVATYGGDAVYGSSEDFSTFHSYAAEQ